MNNSTISLDKAPNGSNYTLARLNTIFQTVADAVNAKFDSRDASVVDLRLNRQRIINVSPGVADSDAVTLAQLDSIAAGTELQKTPGTYRTEYEPWVPIEVTADNFAEAIRANILQTFVELSHKTTVFGVRPLQAPVDANSFRVRLVADAVHPNDAVNLRTLLEYKNATQV